MLDALRLGTPLQLSTVKISSDQMACTGDETAMTNVVYVVDPSNVTVTSDTDSMKFSINLGVNVGTFVVGTVGIYTAAGRLFALATFPGAGIKIANSPPSVLGNIRTLQVLLAYENLSSSVSALAGTALVTGSAVLSAFESMLSTLPTTRPLTPGRLWNLNGVLAIS
jgi:hypothetical protein